MPAFDKSIERFNRHDAQVVGISIDHTHGNAAWAASLGGLSYPLLSDFWPHGEAARAYGVFDEESGRSERAVFLIDREGTVRYIDVHDIGEQPDIDQILEELQKL